MIFGGVGFVGGNIARMALQKGWKVHIADSLETPSEPGISRHKVDITDKDAVESVIERVKPNAAVNVAAVADIDKAESGRELTWRVNVEGAANIAECCARNGVRYVFFSSDAVFDGEGDGYTEETPPNPVNYYGKLKAEAEKAVLAIYPEAVVIRISLVIGFPLAGGNSFLAGLENKLSEGVEIVCPAEEVRTPVDVLTLSECVLELAENEYSGILHIGAIDSINRYVLIKMAAVRMGFDESRVGIQPVHAAKTGRAPRHRNGIISVKKAQGILKTRLLSVGESFERAFLRQNQ